MIDPTSTALGIAPFGYAITAIWVFGAVMIVGFAGLAGAFNQSYAYTDDLHEFIDLFIIRWTGFVSVIGFLVSLVLVGLVGKIIPPVGSHWTLIAEGMTILVPIVAGVVIGPMCGVPFWNLGPFARFNIGWNVLCILIWAQLCGWFGWIERLAAHWAAPVLLVGALLGAAIWFAAQMAKFVSIKRSG